MYNSQNIARIGDAPPKNEVKKVVWKKIKLIKLIQAAKLHAKHEINWHRITRTDSEAT